MSLAMSSTRYEEMLAGLSGADLETGTRLLNHIAERARNVSRDVTP